MTFDIAIKYRILGSTGLKVSEIGYGTWGLGGDSYGYVDDNESKKALRFAFENGVNFYDTADLYGNGHSEEILGDTFKNIRDKVIIATKGGTLPHHGFDMPQDFSPQYLRKALERSLKRLKTDYIDLYQLHSPKIEDIEDENAISTLKAFQKEGKIRFFGISARSPQDGLMVIEKFGINVIQVNFNMIDQRSIEIGLFEVAGKLDVGVIARTPFCFGYLTGTLTGSEQFNSLDHRANWPKEQLRQWAKTPDLFAFLNTDKKRTFAHLALQFCLSDEAVSTVIPGMMNVNEVRENIKAVQMPPLSSEELDFIQEVYQSHNFYDKSIKAKAIANEKK
jgi:aryl-alcohol dehydrogenase-like predicted oxidoreductase